MKKALMMAHVASMIDLFNMDNIELLQELGYKVDVVCNFENGNVTSKERVSEFKQELEAEDIKTYHSPIPRKVISINDMIHSYKIIKKLVDETHYDIVHCQSPIGGVITRIACKKTRKNGTKLIYAAHGFHFYKGSPWRNWLLYYPIEKFAARYTDCIITMNQEDYCLAKKKMNKAIHIEYIPGVGINIDKINKVQVDITKVRKEINIPSDSFVVISVGELNTNKNHKVIIEALAKINNPKIYYVICGQGHLLKELEHLCIKLNIRNNVRFLGYRKDVIKILKACDLFAFPSMREGLSVSLMEAMAIGLPVVCSKIRGNIDLIVDGEGGYIIDLNNTNGYAKAINELYLNRKLCNLMRNYNIENIKKNDIMQIHNCMKKIYLL